MAALMRATDWSATPLGSPAAWPDSLRTALGICLDSRFPILLWWGPELVMLYNDAYSSILDAKHPAALGQSGRECWPEIWDVIGPMLESVQRDGAATWSEDQVLFLERRGFPEECYFTFSYSPIREGTSIGGVFTAVTETTDRVVRERRLATIRALTAGPRRTEEAIATCIDALGGARLDIPYAILFLDGTDDHGPVATSGLDPAAVIGDSSAFGHVADDGTILADLAGIVARPPLSAWGDETRSAIALPLRGGDTERLGTLILGLSPRLAIDDEYVDFVRVVAGRVASALSDARAYETERRRVEELAALDRAKTTFFTNVSHELRTPLTLLLGPLGRLAEAGELSAERTADLDMALRNGRRLHRLVDTLLDFSRIEAGRMEARFESVDLGRLTADIASMFSSAFERAGLRFVVDVTPLPDTVFVDPDMWEKVVVNLLSNALKFTLEGTVALSVADHDGRAELRVRDTGVGVRADDVPRLFERFVRLDHPAARSNEGTGIGLALTAELVRIHGGAIEATSAPGRGTTFVVRLPYGSAHLPAAQVVERGADRPDGIAGPVIEEALGWLPAERGSATLAVTDGAASAEDGVPPGTTGLEGARILVADDNADMRAYVSSLLEGAHVEGARNGEEALTLVRSWRPDLVLADVMMPVLGGFGLLARIRADDAVARTPVMLLSARAGEEASVEGLRAGADDYLVKPFSASELVARVTARVVASREREREEAALREAERRWTAVSEQSPAFVALLSTDGRTLSLSRAWRNFLGVAEGSGIAWAAIIHPDDREAFVGRSRTSLSSGEAFTSDAIRIRGADGTYRWFESVVAPIGGHGPGIGLWVSVSHDIDERKTTEEALRRREAELREALRAKDEFLGLVSHELRTPLTTIVGVAQLLARGLSAGDPAAYAELLSDLVADADRLSRVVENLLTLSRLSEGVAPDLEPVLLGLTLERVVAVHRRMLPRRLITVDGRRDTPIVLAREGYLEQIIANLVSNADKYSPPDAPIEIGCSVLGDEVVIGVADRGIGIDASEADSLFDPFYRSPRTAAKAGIGIGLTVCQRLAEAQRGRIWAEPREGGGAIFRLALPIAEAAAA